MPYLDSTSDAYDAEFRNNSRAYVFKFKHGEGEYFDVDYPCILSHMDGEGRTDLPHFDLVAHPLFKGVDFGRVNYDRPFELFFRPVLAMRPMDEKFPLTVDIFTVVIPEDTLKRIQTSLKAVGLSAHEGFFFFLICKIQQL